ncbi:MAG: cytoskeleton protein [Halomonas sp. 54_146]|nr:MULTISPECIES: RodZ domain-containing protein [unclassified Halomonas]KUJ87706.1 MAG: cytoskeleton protein [Halomonas sp. 54_146]HAA44997.1 DUF4115 domain-containing protein [Halomonas sp.]
MSGTQSQESVINSTTTASPGELLFRQREQLGVPLADAARALNLRPAVVAGLEQDNYQEIPVAAYRRGYLRAYAKYLGMDDRLVLEAYQARSGGTDTERKVSPVSTVRPPSRLGAWLFKLVTLLVIVGLIAVTVMWWQSRGGNEPPGLDSSTTNSSTTNSSTTNASATNEPANAPAQSPGALTETSGESAAASSSFTTSEENAGLTSDAARITPTPAPTTSQSPASGDAGESAEADVAEVGIAESDVAETDVTESDAAESESPSIADAEPAARANTLELTFNEQSWTEIFDATNQRVFVGLQSPGTSTTVEGEPPFRLTVGNATGVELRYQGEEVDLPARAGANNVARFTLGE